MPDPLTTLQESLDQVLPPPTHAPLSTTGLRLTNPHQQLASQMFASLNYLTTHHTNAEIPSQQYHGPLGKDYEPKPSRNGISADDEPSHFQSSVEDDGRIAESPELLKISLEEMSRDLVGKEQEVEGMVRGLPGGERGREEQEGRLRELDGELRGVHAELEEAGREKEELIKRVEDVIWRVNRY